MRYLNYRQIFTYVNWLGLPAGTEPIIFTALGYPADSPGPKIRKPLADLVSYEHW
jgi:hypothetical protein